MAEATKPMKETPKAKEACEQYLLLGPDRSLAKLAKHLGRPPGYERTLKDWSTAHHWQERARAYDQEQFDKRRRDHQARIDQMNDEHYLIGRTQSLKAMARIEKLIASGEIHETALVQYFKAATSLQRLAAGAATEQLALTGKDGGPIEQDVIVETFWGRGTDPRRKVEPPAEQEGDADTEIDVEFGEDGDEEP